MTTLVLMAGDGTRFRNSEYGINPYKPFIRVKGQTILEWTLSSMPDLYGRRIYAIRSDHDKEYAVTDYLKSLRPCEIVRFDKLTRGNLETALLTCERAQVNPNESLMVLDSDNYFDGNCFRGISGATMGHFLGEPEPPPFAMIAYFKPLDDSHKWCFAMTEADGMTVTGLREKDPQALKDGGMPMVGVFYFSRADLFTATAKRILESGERVRNEFFMSQSVQYLISNKSHVTAREVTNVHPLGTPEDVKRFETI